MFPKFVLLAYCLLPLSVFGQTRATSYNPITQSVPVGLVFYPENNVVIPGRLHFQYGDDYSLPLAGKEDFGQQVYTEPLSLISMIGPDKNKMGASATGGVVYTGSEDIFAYTHYGRTGKLIWRTSPIANNMMATRWSLANINIFRRASLPSISDQLR